MELYSTACGELKRLCPRPVPPSLRLARLGVVALFDPLLLAGLFSADEASVEELVSKIGLLLRSSSQGKCSICGKKKAKGPWEFWSYLVEPREGRGVAVLEAVAPVCEKCMEALMLNPAGMDKKKWKNIVKWVSKVNKAKKDRVEELLRSIIDEYHLVAVRVTKWNVDVSRLAEHGIDHVLAKVILEKLAEEHFDLRARYLVARNPKAEASAQLIAEEDLNSFCGGTLDAAVLAARAMRRGLEPNWDNIAAYMDYLRERNICSMPVDRASLYTQGAWVAVLTREQRAAAMKSLMARMSEEEEVVWTLRVETPYQPLDRPEVRAYSPSAFTLDIVVKVAEELASALRDAGLKIIRLSFRPQRADGELLPYAIYSYATA